MSSINLNPTGVYNGYEYSVDGTTSLASTAEGVYIPLDQITELSAAEADDGLVTSDYRKLIWGLLDKAYTHQEGLEDAPENMTITRSSLVFNGEDQVQRSYSVTFQYSVGSFDVKDEGS